jgi:predicted adenylyl cyclase CyaB
MKNIEVKMAFDDPESIISVLRKIGAKHKGRLHQIDTYYRCRQGRLKLRTINDRKHVLIFYTRPDTLSGKVSEYQVFPIGAKRIKNAESLLTRTFGKLIKVEKTRDLWVYKNTRVHLDRVSGLGRFLELETVVKKDVSKARKEYDDVTKRLALSRYKKERGSYSDLLMKKQNVCLRTQKPNQPEDVPNFLKDKL